MLQIAKVIPQPKIIEGFQEYEVDELQTFVGSKNNRQYIIYAINRKTKVIIDYVIGTRTKENIRKVTEKLLMLNPTRIFTDKLNIYPTLIEKQRHIASAYKINHIERFNLNLRTHLKRLSRKTICFSRSIEMLMASLKIYFHFGLRVA